MIKARFRNRGIGTKLIEEIIELYRKFEVKSISLSVDKNNPAFGLYKRIGFEVKTETENAVILWRELEMKKTAHKNVYKS